MVDHLDAEAIARLSLHDPANFSLQQAQTQHRLELVRHWDIPAGATVLELGCGQGDCTTVLASAVGEQGKVVAVDPAPLDYGTPYTLAQAQNHISAGPLGPRIQWIRDSPVDFLASLPPNHEQQPFSAAVLAHSLWYFASPSAIQSTFRALRPYTSRLLLAEWSLTATQPSAQPHVLAALAQAALECRKADSESNVRTVLAPRLLRESAVRAGWTLEREGRVVCGEGVLDGRWEVGAVLDPGFEREVEERVRDERERGVVMALRDTCEASLDGVEGGVKGVRAMDVWVASFA